MALTKKQRQEVWGRSGGKCWYCGCDLPLKGWHADHFKAVKRRWRYRRDDEGLEKKVYVGMDRPRNDSFDNYVPSCASCNLFKHSLTIEQFRDRIEIIKTSIFHHSIAKIAKRYGFLEIKSEPVVFWFEKNKQ